LQPETKYLQSIGPEPVSLVVENLIVVSAGNRLKWAKDGQGLSGAGQSFDEEKILLLESSSDYVY
jgi:hypothetical protein